MKFKNIYILSLGSAALLYLLVISIYTPVYLHIQRDLAHEREERLLQQLSQKAESIMGHFSNLVLIMRYSGYFDIGENREIEKDRVIEYFKKIAEAIPEFYQIRYIDETGMEVVRIDKKDNTIEAVNNENLQDKHDRYYFIETAKLNCGELYVSPFDLNIEHGKIEVPWRPTIRISTPVYCTEQKFRGIVIVNIDMSEIVDIFKKDQHYTAFLLNQEGYYLAGVKNKKLFGFIFDHNTSFAQEYPELWETIKTGTQGFLELGSLSFFFRPLDFSSLLSRYLGKDNRYPKRWYVVLQTEIFSHGKLLSFTGIWFYIFLFLVFESIGLIVAMIISYKGKIRKINREHADRLIKMDKLASLGSIVAGIAHSLNTPIGNSKVLISSLQERLDSLVSSINTGELMKSEIDSYTNDADNAFQQVEENLKKASSLIDNFKQISVSQSLASSEVIDLKLFLEELADTIYHSLKTTNIQIKVKCDKGIKVETCPGDLYQVLINIVRNAIVHGLAMNKGVITLTGKRLLSGKISIIVIDTGRGIKKEDLPYIFDPFYSTRMSDSGGLGLHIVDNIVTGVLGGAVSVETKVGKWTRFIIDLPQECPKKKKEKEKKNGI